ncbi:MAG: DUF6273 domain-containing protein [Eubacterium sp.]|nr:DUF6273 domain-containing protein [Eubacterium sp.]
MKITRKVSEQVDFEHMRARINAGAVAEVVRPGDELEIPLENGETVIAVCAGYISDYRARFVLKDALGDHRMNDRPTNYGGYLKSEGRRHVLEDILPLFPAWLREAMKPRHMVEIIDGETHEYADTLWLPSATDVFGPRPWWNEEPDSEQLEIFKTERGRVKERDGETVSWWLRSPRATNATAFVNVDTDGTVTNYNAYNSLAFAPGFDL